MIKRKNLLKGITIPKYTDTYTYYSTLVDATVWSEQVLTPSVAKVGLLEDISYDDGPKTIHQVVDTFKIEYPSFKACKHTSRYVMYNEGSSVDLSASRYVSGRWVKYSRHIPGLPHHTWYDFGNIPVATKNLGYNLLPSDIAYAFSNEAASLIKYKALDESKLLGFPDAFNVLNFILELRDIKRLPELITKLRGNSHDISDKYLGVNFGALPFFGDIMSIINRVSNSGESVSKWNDMAAKGRILNGHTNLPPPGLITSHKYFKEYKKGVAYLEATNIPYHIAQADFAMFSGSQDMIVNVRQEIKAIGHVYFLPRKITNIGEIKRNLWGVNKPLTAIWNAIPFSFVLDWVADIGVSIQTFEKSEELLRMQILSAGYSVKVTTYVEQRTTFGGVGTGVVIGKHVHYERVPLSPGSILTAGKFYPFEFRLLSGSQTILGSALLHQLLKH